MPKINFEQSDVQVENFAGETLLNIALDHGINIEHGCGGNAVCGTCRVRITAGNDKDDITAEEYDILEEDEIEKDVRLACCYIVNNDITVEA